MLGFRFRRFERWIRGLPIVFWGWTPVTRRSRAAALERVRIAQTTVDYNRRSHEEEIRCITANAEKIVQRLTPIVWRGLPEIDTYSFTMLIDPRCLHDYGRPDHLDMIADFMANKVRHEIRNSVFIQKAHENDYKDRRQALDQTHYGFGPAESMPRSKQ